MWSTSFIVIGALSLTSATALSAFGFHGLGDDISPAKMQSWVWAGQMHFYHSLALILIGALQRQWGGSKLMNVAGLLMLAGLVMFSGSIYAEILGASEALGEIAPYGGNAFMLGWLFVAAAAIANRPHSQ